MSSFPWRHQRSPWSTQLETRLVNEYFLHFSTIPSQHLDTYRARQELMPHIFNIFNFDWCKSLLSLKNSQVSPIPIAILQALTDYFNCLYGPDVMHQSLFKRACSKEIISIMGRNKLFPNLTCHTTITQNMDVSFSVSIMITSRSIE